MLPIGDMYLLLSFMFITRRLIREITWAALQDNKPIAYFGVQIPAYLLVGPKPMPWQTFDARSTTDKRNRGEVTK